MNKTFGSYSLTDAAKDIVFPVVGSALVGFALSVFTIPNDIAPGGVSGLATVLAHVTPIRVSVWALIMNIPLLIAAQRRLGTRTLVYTLLSTLLLSAFIEIGERFGPKYTTDPLLASLMGGAVSGAGMGLLFIRGISTGGTDLLALILRKLLPNVSAGTLLLFVDATVVLVAVLVFRDFDVAIYSAVTILISSKLIDTITQGVDYAKVVYVVTARGDEVSRALNENTERGTTVIPAFGGYTGEGKQIVMTVTRRRVLSQTLQLIRRTDPKAFVFVTDSTEVRGEGFKSDD